MREINRVVVELGDLADGRHCANAVLPVVNEIAQPDQRHLMAPCDRFARKTDGRVIVLLGGDIIDNKGDLDCRVPTLALGFRLSQFGWLGLGHDEGFS